MRLSIFLSVMVLLLAASLVNAQVTPDSGFAAFSKQHYPLLVEAYKKKDVAQYNVLLKEFLNKYGSLDKDQQKLFAPYLMGAYYNLSCAYSLLNNKPSAITYLDKAIKAGYTNYAHLQQDTDLDNIRKEKAFATVVQPMREFGDYIYILKKDNRFTTTDSIMLPAFTYQSADNPQLVSLRQQFKLDSVAGEGSDVSKVLNVLHWVHNTIHHDGATESGITSINGLAIAAAAKAKNIGVSCGELATVLNDCYLSLGFKSRKIYCFPKDSLSTDYDSHVINVVYLPQLKKWIWVDPTNDAYVMNDKGELLSIAEVRDRLVHDKPLISNPDANWNHRLTITKVDYLDNYMSKNVYRFYCTLESGFDVETKGGEKTITYIYLAPVGYGKFKDRPVRTESYNKDIKTTIVRYTTHNPAAFWQVP
ncbi:MAG: transglutaminase domain-containing protein [Chitinophagaceae bacterium]